MENNGDEVCYSTVNIKSRKSPPRETEEEPTIYSEVKQKKAAPAETGQEKEETAALCGSRLMLLCLGILSVLLVVSITVIVYLSMKTTTQQTEINNLIYNTTTQQVEINNLNNNMTTQQTEINNLNNEKTTLQTEIKNLTNNMTTLQTEIKNLNNNMTTLQTEIKNLTNNMTTLQIKNQNLTKENERMTEENEMMQNKTKELNKTLGFIKRFDNFPVKDYCSNKECGPCPKNWILFEQKCYLFYEEPAPWKTWEQSRTFCQNKNADLVVIDNQKEQEFVTNHTIKYKDEWHGYWIGLQQVNNNWTWIDGRVDTLRFWINGNLRGSGPYAHLNPYGTVKANWGEPPEKFENKFICELQAVIWQI
ncbi:C-type lectin domain family 4 member G-like isoform X1 [Gambusia affinis]|uniref:C-type lectin domain family 4 member G-like isoform X1 n=1 Tax=Gambusia affinis TaxID=33528 RepID=UPI001CDC1F9D|nr:C-type lectin domain family 4 member G-like isoform X1 [Gambusia affinis]